MSFHSPVRVLACAAVIALAGCASVRQSMPSLDSLAVYKIDINQGNYLSQDMVDKLKVGMTHQQVKLTLGTPLIQSAFRDNRWDYVYEYAHQGKVREHRNFTVWFDDQGRLARWEGDEMPASVVDLNQSAEAKALPTPSDPGKGWWQRIKDVFSRKD